MINQIYKNKEIIAQMWKFYNKNSMLKIQNFLDSQEKLLKKINMLDFQNKQLPGEYSYSESKNIPINKKEIKDFLSNFIKINKISIALRRYKHRDYTLLTDSSKKIKAFCIIDLTKTWNNNSDGYTSFIKNNEEILRIYPEYNTFTLVDGKQTKVFVKYLNCLTDKKRTTIEITIL